MISQLNRNKEMAQGLKNFIDSQGGPYKVRWASAAIFLQHHFSVQVTFPSQLKKIYLSYISEKRTYELDEMAAHVDTFLKAKCFPLEAVELLAQTKYKYDYPKDIIKKRQSASIRYVMRELVLRFGRRKQHFRTQLTKFSYKTIQVMLKIAADPENPTSSDHFKEVRKHAIYLYKAFKCFAKHYDRYDFYCSVSKAITRYQFESALAYLFYLDDLKGICLGKFHDDGEMNVNPLLEKTIQGNMELEVYQRYIDESDWIQKLKEFNKCQDEEDRNRIYCSHNINGLQLNQQLLNDPLKRKYKIQYVQKQKQDKTIKKRRGKLVLPGDPIYRNQRTVVFNPQKIKEKKNRFSHIETEPVGEFNDNNNQKKKEKGRDKEEQEDYFLEQREINFYPKEPEKIRKKVKQSRFDKWQAFYEGIFKNDKSDDEEDQ